MRAHRRCDRPVMDIDRSYGTRYSVSCLTPAIKSDMVGHTPTPTALFDDGGEPGESVGLLAQVVPGGHDSVALRRRPTQRPTIVKQTAGEVGRMIAERRSSWDPMMRGA